MKKFLIVSSVFLLGALLVSTLVFWYISTNYELEESNNIAATSADIVSTSTPQYTESTTTELAPAISGETQFVPHVTQDEVESIPLNTLPLTESQRELLDTAGINIDTYVITPDAISCAQVSLGEERFEEIISGSAPGPLEAMRLLPCL